MSHISDTKAHIKDLDALDRASDKRGLALARNVRKFKYYANQEGFCDHVIRSKTHVAGDFEIGVVPRLEGDGWTLSYDNYGQGRKLDQLAGAGLNGLKQEYATEVIMAGAKEELVRKGWEVDTEQLSNGRRRIALRLR
jgi:hypothetical protein